MPYLQIFPKKLNSFYSPNPKIIKTSCPLLNSNTCSMVKNTSSIKWNSIDPTSLTKRVNSISPLPSSIGILTSQRKSHWTRIKNSSFLIISSLYRHIQSNPKQLHTSSINLCIFFINSSKYDSDGQVKGVNTVVYIKKNAEPFNI